MKKLKQRGVKSELYSLEMFDQITSEFIDRCPINIPSTFTFETLLLINNVCYSPDMQRVLVYNKREAYREKPFVYVLSADWTGYSKVFMVAHEYLDKCIDVRNLVTNLTPK